jgi:Uma2 family endonuclease
MGRSIYFAELSTFVARDDCRAFDGGSRCSGSCDGGGTAESIGRFEVEMVTVVSAEADFGYGGTMSSALKPPATMTVAEFLVWDAPDDRRWQLVDGEPVAMAPANRTNGALQAEFARVIANHFTATGRNCSVVTAGGIVPRVRAGENFRIPDLTVTCAGYEAEEYDVSDPVLLAEIVSPSNKSQTWQNVWTFTTLPSVREILLLSTVSIRADLLRRGDDGSWPAAVAVIESGDLTLESIGLTVPLAEIYRTTRLARE